MHLIWSTNLLWVPKRRVKQMFLYRLSYYIKCSSNNFYIFLLHFSLYCSQKIPEKQNQFFTSYIVHLYSRARFCNNKRLFTGRFVPSSVFQFSALDWTEILHATSDWIHWEFTSESRIRGGYKWTEQWHC